MRCFVLVLLPFRFLVRPIGVNEKFMNGTGEKFNQITIVNGQTSWPIVAAHSLFPSRTLSLLGPSLQSLNKKCPNEKRRPNAKLVSTSLGRRVSRSFPLRIGAHIHL